MQMFATENIIRISASHPTPWEYVIHFDVQLISNLNVMIFYFITESDAGEIGARAAGGARSSGNLFRRKNSGKETGP